jgi:hypothetical protein
MSVEIRDVAPGLWLWRQPHPDWDEDADWGPEVASFAVESEGVGVLVDPLAPPPSARQVWDRIEAMRPTVVAVLKPDHLRDVELFVRWYGAARSGPSSSGPTTSHARTLSDYGPAISCPVGCRRCTTDVKAWRRRSTCPSSGRSSSPTA